MKRVVGVSALMLVLGTVAVILSNSATIRAVERLCAQYGGLRVQNNYRPPNFFFGYPPLTDKNLVNDGDFPPYKKNVSNISILPCENSPECKSNLPQDNAFSFVDKKSLNEITIITNTRKFICNNYQKNVKFVSKKWDMEKFVFLQYECPISFFKNSYGISEMRYLSDGNGTGYVEGVSYSYEDYLVYNAYFYKIYYSGWFLKRPNDATPAVSYAEFGIYSVFDKFKIETLIENYLGIFADKSSNYCAAPPHVKIINGASDDGLALADSFSPGVAYKSGIQMEMRR